MPPEASPYGYYDCFHKTISSPKRITILQYYMFAMSKTLLLMLLCLVPTTVAQVCATRDECPSPFDDCQGNVCIDARGRGCTVDDNCPPALSCIRGQCQEPKSNGSVCDDDDDCESGVCQLLRCRGKSVGSLCGKDSDCDSGVCHLTKCRGKQEGDTCGSNEDCDESLICDFPGGFSTRKCSQLFFEGDGGSCARDSQCVDGQYCIIGIARLAANGCFDGSEGDRCNKNSQCQGDLICRGGLTGVSMRCEKPANRGQHCREDSDCEHYCQALKCRDGRRNDKCRNSGECQDGLTCKKRCKICAQKVCK